MKIIKMDNQNRYELLKRSSIDSSQVTEQVKTIIWDVRNFGDEKLKYFTEKFDGVQIDELRVSSEEIEAAYQRTDPQIINALQEAAHNIRAFHKEQLPEDWFIEIEAGVKAGQIIRPLNRVGCYIPGGRAAYPSSILMTVIPARIAGVDEIICCTPPQKDGLIDDKVLIAADISGVDDIYRVGGSQAIAAMAYGTETIKSVDKIVGPGNVYVTAAKKLVYGDVDIEFPAGPSEVLIIADESANPQYIAMDMLAQAEHDPQAASLLITDSFELAENVSREIELKLVLMHRKDIIEESLANYGHIILSSSLEEAVEFSNLYAPEHLIIMTSNPGEVLEQIENAGSIFLGNYTPVAAGDYGSGTNHVLPTGGGARLYSGLSTESFLKKPTVQEITASGLNRLKDMIISLAEAEGLYAHAESCRIRTRKQEKGKD